MLVLRTAKDWVSDTNQPGTVAHTFNPSNGEAETGGPLISVSSRWLLSETVSQVNTERERACVSVRVCPGYHYSSGRIEASPGWSASLSQVFPGAGF